MTASASLLVTACLGTALLGGCALGGGAASQLVHHDFADRQVCEREEITLKADGGLVRST